MSSKVIIEGAGFLPVVQVDSLVRTSLRLCGTLPVLLPAAAAELPVPDLALELLVDVLCKILHASHHRFAPVYLEGVGFC